MQEEQEPSVTDILSSIRQILSNKLEGDEMNAIEPPVFDLQEESEGSSFDSFDENISEITEEEVVFLTPQMKIQQSLESAMTDHQSINESTPAPELPKTSLEMEENIQPLIQEWLDKHLPQMVERIVSEEVRRIFNKR